ncbi:MAG: efflux RND transporter periplasmic adaptor subunit [Paracoccaceae bacterium]
MALTPIRAGLAAALLALVAASPAAPQGMPAEPPVDVAAPLTDEVIDYDVYTGRFEAAEIVELRARVSGYLSEQRFTDGALVEKGQVLFVIDQRPFQNAVEGAKAALESAKAARQLAQVELDRALQLAERNVGTQQEVDRTRAQMTQAEAEVRVAETDVAEAELDLEFTTINAPFSGRISDGEVDPGNLVVGGTSGTTLLATVVRIAPIHFTFTASEADYLRYSRLIPIAERPAGEGTRRPAAIKLIDEDDFVHEAYLDFVDNRLNPDAGTIEVRAVVEEPADVLVPGVFGRIRTRAGEPYEAPLIPDDAILSDQADKIVLTVDGENKVRPARVTLGPLHRGLRAIREGLSADTRVIVAGVMRAQPGQTVQPNEVKLEFED